MTVPNFYNIIPTDIYPMYQFALNSFALQFYCFPTFPSNWKKVDPKYTNGKSFNFDFDVKMQSSLIHTIFYIKYYESYKKRKNFKKINNISFNQAKLLEKSNRTWKNKLGIKMISRT